MKQGGILKIRVVYACDENYAALTAISAVSVLCHNPNAEIILLGCNLGEAAKETVRSRVTANGGQFSFHDVSPRIKSLERANCCKYTSYAIYSRFFIPEILSDNGRALYLDCDTLVRGSLAPLFELDMGKNPIALGGDCVPFPYKKLIGVSRDVPYFNSGVMLMDLGKWRERHCSERVFSELANPSAPNPLPDQDVMVRVFAGEVKPLEPKWNFISQYWMMSYSGLVRIVGSPVFAKDALDAAQNGGAVIHHFSGNTFGRPWFADSKHPMRRTYIAVAEKTGLRDFAMQRKPMPRQYVLQYLFWKLLPKYIFNIVYPYVLKRHICRFYGIW